MAIPGSLFAIGPDAAGDSTTAASTLERARRFRKLLEDKDYDSARALMAGNSRRWWGEREGAGSPWTIGPAAVSSPWHAWDRFFHSESEVLEWRSGPRSATAVVRETNDYYRLLDRGAMTNELVYLFDAQGKIEGLVIKSAGPRPPGKTAEFVAWAKKNAPSELRELMPNGEIDPGGDHPARFRKLLERWRRQTGLPAIR
jgi:hypothetical protein